MVSFPYTKEISVPHQSEELVCMLHMCVLVVVVVVMGKWKGLYCDFELGRSTGFLGRKTRGTEVLTMVVILQHPNPQLSWFVIVWCVVCAEVSPHRGGRWAIFPNS